MLNADGGVREYFTRYRQVLTDLMNDLEPTSDITDEFIDKAAQDTDNMVGDKPRAEIRQWRDQMIKKICALKRE